MLVSGKVTDKGDGLSMAGANVYLSDSEGNKGSNPIGAAANVDGLYSFDTQDDSYFTSGQYIAASFIGYKTVVKELVYTNFELGLTVNFELEESSTMFEEIVITPDGNEKQKPKWGKIALISGLSLSAIIVGILLYKKYK